MKLTVGLNFINVLCTAFTLADPKSVKKTVKLSIFFTLLGSASVKAAHRMLMQLSPDLRHCWTLSSDFIFFGNRSEQFQSIDRSCFGMRRTNLRQIDWIRSVKLISEGSVIDGKIRVGLFWRFDWITSS